MMPPVFLIGARGCGKTTTGYELARTLGYTFRDTDHYLQQTMQRTIAEIVAQEGWDAFRQYEREALLAVTQSSTVIATGGGIVLAEHNCRHMREQGTVIWLTAESAVLAARLDAQPEAGQRPALTGYSAAEEMRRVLAEREVLYHSTAHYIVNATQRPEQIVEQVCQRLGFACVS
ncbi:shikimate kinase AroL [Enterobacteriaceae bacterium LUAb1]